ncbi:mono/diheme cytochrome c family protein [Oikeobacillus pervagus]|uniref:Mono/diheme cytochrome c family protein n=1 Tax=Oikeobacillus pervagus TaxID=1325931 RepID=A0AAJ1WK75_9BACI|nr:c-type cytochrome [Oikeobacillus pervagus]MDQ0216283.1 mono/diheme cytochrome c family protein [Oikeobacillus pervagus]
MNFPTVEFPWFGNGTIIALIAIVHVVISHGVAIGATTLMVTAEYNAFRQKDQKLDAFAKKMAKWILIITTTAGAMTGVGIWFSTTVIQPDSIGSLLRIFFWAWVAEWVVFISEVVLLIIYYYTWDMYKESAKKIKHIRIGIALCISSWITAAIITGVLAAKLTPGKWIETYSFWHAFFNPTYLPSLGFRTFLALLLAIGIVSFFVKWRVKDQALKNEIFRIFSIWAAISIPGILITAIWYLQSIPQEAYDLVVYSTGMSEKMFDVVNLTGLTVILLFIFWAAIKPKTLPFILSFAVLCASMGFIAEFEFVRESVRKPFVIYDYMYANGVLEKDAEKYNKEGVLAHSTFAKNKEVTVNNMYEAGREVYQGQCMTCHTVSGWRSKRAFENRLDGWSEETIKNFIPTMHHARPVMPPFVGTEEELAALSHYLHEVVNKEKGTEQVKGEEKNDRSTSTANSQ